MRHLKGMVYGMLFTGVACLAAFIVRKQAVSRWHDSKISGETADAIVKFADFFLNRWYILMGISVVLAVGFYHVLKKPTKEEE